ncbi:MAG: methionyl-tRNA formyltransferase [Bradyrhizobium sp.]|nr:MAG: methionyl-tRNA formyltransferase [Bradyrhizobium sp.]
MRVIFMGTPEFATPALSALVEQGHEVAAVYTRAPRPAGPRGLEPMKSPVHRLADSLGLPVVTTTTLRTPEAQEAFRAYEADVALVAAYGLILPPPVLAAPRLGCLNIHASLLPRWRGAAPIQRAIMAGDAETGVDLMRMEAGLDTGPVALELRTGITAHDTTGDLSERLAGLGARLIADGLPTLAAGQLVFRPQNEDGAVYARKIDKSEAAIDWTATAKAVRNQIHGLSPSPGAFGEISIGERVERIKIFRAEVVEGGGAPGVLIDAAMTIACGGGAIRVTAGQRAGRNAMSGAELARGAKLAAGARFNLAAPPRTAQ